MSPTTDAIRFPRTRFVSLAVSVASVCFACVTGPDDDALTPVRDASPLQTDSVSYRLVRTQHEFSTVVAGTFTNSTGRPIYFQRCLPRDSTPIFYVGRTGPDSARRFFVDWAWACVGGVPTGVLAPGRSLTIRARVGSIDQPTMQPRLKPQDLVGLLRIRLALCARFRDDSDYCEPTPEWQTRSNAFLVHY